MAEPDMLNGDIGALLALKEKWAARRDVERCELCARVLSDEHPHLVDVAARRIVCSCEPCAMLFDNASGARYSRIPRDAEMLDDVMDDTAWNSLAIPINLAFFFFSSAAGRMMAMYPSPGGATEAELSAEAWDGVAHSSPLLQQLRRDVEALLVNRLRTPAECYIAPIDRCYELTGLIRTHWAGFSGGDAVWREVDAFFDRLRGHARRAGAPYA